MDFLKAFSETTKNSASDNGSPAPVHASGNESTAVTSTPDLTSDDMKAYVDAKFEALKSDLLTEMQSLSNKVETPEETDNSQENNNNSQNEGGNENASSTDLSSS